MSHPFAPAFVAALAVALAATLPSVLCAAPPSITLQPVDLVVRQGGSEAFHVEAAGTTPLTFQWSRNGVLIPAGTGTPYGVLNGATFSSLDINTTTPAVAGTYRVTVSNAEGTINSRDVTLIVNLNGTPLIQGRLSNVATSEGQAVSLGLSVFSTPPATIQWHKNGQPIPGATRQSITFNPVKLSDAGAYFLTATNPVGTATSHTATVVVSPMAQPPADALPHILAIRPGDMVVAAGTWVEFSVQAGGFLPLRYQWHKNGTPLPGMIADRLSVPSVSAADVGAYSVTVTNLFGSVTSAPMQLALATAPRIIKQPESVTVLTGAQARFSVQAEGSAPLVFQWRKDGALLPGQTATACVIPAASAAETGAYTVTVTNAHGSVTSAPASLSLVLAPVITAQPRDAVVAPGNSARFSVEAGGTPPFIYQWRNDGVAVTGQTAAICIIPAVTFEDVGAYTVSVSNAAGAIASAPATLATTEKYGAAAYFGTIGTNAGVFALYVTATNQAFFLAFDSVTRITTVQRDVTISDDGSFSFPLSTGVSLAGRISGDGSVSGTYLPGGTILAGRRSLRTSGPLPSVAGFYQAGQANRESLAYAIADASSRIQIFRNSPAGGDSGFGTIDSSGLFSGTTSNNALFRGNLDPIAGTITLTLGSPAGPSEEFVGSVNSRPVFERLVNISSRARAGSGTSSLIAGFVVSGHAPKPILVRGVGPTLSTFGVSGALPLTKLDLNSGSGPLASNIGWASAPNANAIAAATQRVGAFPLPAGSGDSALLLTLEPGSYTAMVASADGAAGVALVEVYDASEGVTAGPAISNLSARSVTGAGSDTLIAGYTISGMLPKRVLVRAVGPTLANLFGVAGTLADPVLRIVRAADGVVVATNDNWGDSTGGNAIAAAASAVGAFALVDGSHDAALLINLPPGNYSVLISSNTSAAGVVLAELYEVP